MAHMGFQKFALLMDCEIKSLGLGELGLRAKALGFRVNVRGFG